MQIEHFLFTRTQRQDFTAFIRPSALSSREVSIIGATFNYITDISRLSADFPSLYCFPLGGYFLLLRHYNSGRSHAGRAIGVIEGIAVKQMLGRTFARALPYCVLNHDKVLSVASTIGDLETLTARVSDEQALSEGAESPQTLHGERGFIADFLARIETERLFVPFNRTGLNMLTLTLADQPYASPLFFAFGTNSDVVGELLTRDMNLDVVSFFNTDAPSFRSRDQNQKTADIDAYTRLDEPPPALMNAHESSSDDAPAPSMRLRRAPAIPTADDVTSSDNDSSGINLRGVHSRSARPQPEHFPMGYDEENADPVLTPRQLRDQLREQAASLDDTQPHQPVRLSWLARLWQAIIGKPSSTL